MSIHCTDELYNIFILLSSIALISAKNVPCRNKNVKITNENSRACFNKKKPQKVQAVALIP